MGLVVVKGSLRSGSDWYKFDYWMELTPHLQTSFLWFLETTFSLPSQNEHFNRSKTNFWQFPDWYNHHRRSNWTVIYELWNVSITNLDDSGSENALQYRHSCDIKKYVCSLFIWFLLATTPFEDCLIDFWQSMRGIAVETTNAGAGVGGWQPIRPSSRNNQCEG